MRTTTPTQAATTNPSTLSQIHAHGLPILPLPTRHVLHNRTSLRLRRAAIWESVSRLSLIQAMEESNTTPYEPPGNRETMVGSSSIEHTLPPLRPRASWMIDDGDERTEAQADADWHRANDWLRAEPAPALRNRYHHCLPLDDVLSHPPTMYDAPPFHPTPAWDHPTPCSLPTPTMRPQPRPGNHSSGTTTTAHMVPNPNLSLGDQGAAGTLAHQPPVSPSQTRTRTCNPTLSPLLPSKVGQWLTLLLQFAILYIPATPSLATRELTIGLDSYSDVTVAHRDIVYNVRPITDRTPLHWRWPDTIRGGRISRHR
jgi:hypothetical protein